MDDEPLAHAGLEGLLERQPQVESVTEARNGREAIALIVISGQSLVLLDVQMPAASTTVRGRPGDWRDSHHVMIFVTAHRRPAIRAFKIAGSTTC